MRVTAPPSRERLTALALRTLDDALALAEHGPVKRTFGHRLALAWLAHEGIGLPWHYDAFWKAMAEEHATQIGEYPRYMRTRDLTGLLNHWYLSPGWEIPNAVQRGEWERRVTPGGARAKPPPRISVSDRPPELEEPSEQ